MKGQQTLRPSFLKAHGKKAAVILALAVIAGGAVFFRNLSPTGEAPKPGGKNFGGNRPQPVSVAEARIGDMPIWVQALGTAVPRRLVTVRSRVDGELVKLHFSEGDLVKQGQAIADIDPRPFQVQLMQAKGQLARDAALLKNAEVDFERYKDLWAKDSIARQQLDTQEALVRQYKGTVEADRGQVESAQLQLSYAHITAPVSGRIGLRQVDPGNQVHASDANGLAVIAQVQPMDVVFALPESYLRAVQQRLAAGDTPIVVEAWDREQKNRIAAGRLLTLDNVVDTATGTVKLKAEFANDDGALFPNQFVNARLLLGVRKEATIIPGAAILRGAKGAFVYVVDGEGTVSTVPVTPGPADGDLVAVEGTLPAGSRVVTDGADKLRDGARVEVISAEARAAADQKAGGGRGKRREGGATGEGGERRPEGAGKPDHARRAEGGPPPAAN